jgi:nucleoid-associated protein YgaU
MTRETKVGLLIGLGVILLIGIIVSDYLSVAQLQEPAGQAMTEFGPRAAQSIQSDRQPGGDSLAETAGGTARHARPIPTPEELASPAVASPAQPQPRPDAPLAQGPSSRSIYVPLLRTDRDANDRSNAPATQVIPTPAELTLDELAPAPPVFGPQATGTAPLPAPERALASMPASAPGPVAVATETPQPARSTIVHHVAEGETLFQIAQRYYGDGEQWPTIVKHNPQRVRDNGHVGVGVRLILPAQPDDRRAQLRRAANDALVGPAARTVTVRGGDTLIGLAQEHLGDGGRWKDLLLANAGKMDGPKDLRVGMTLNLPANPAATRSPTPRPNAAASYTVKSGDTLYRIAESTLGDGDRWQEIFRANRDQLASPDNLKVGQTLRLPS